MNRYIPFLILGLLYIATYDTYGKDTSEYNEGFTKPSTFKLYFPILDDTERIVIARQRQGAPIADKGLVKDIISGYSELPAINRIYTFSAFTYKHSGGYQLIPLSLSPDNLPSFTIIPPETTFSKGNPKIVCDNIGSNGIGSAYLTHTFNLEKDEDISTYLWHFYVMNQDGEYIEVSGGDTTPSFTIPAIDDPEKYAISDGCLSGMVECIYSMSDTQYRTILFPVTLELKPIIISIDNINRIPTDGRFYYVTFTVNYRGADKVSLEIEEEYSTYKLIKEINEPYIAHANIGQFHSLYNNWITIVVRNKYGTAEKTLEFAPEQVSIDDIMASDPDRLVEVFTLQGISVFKGKASEYEESSLTPGMYIRRWVGTDGRVHADKFMIH